MAKVSEFLGITQKQVRNKVRKSLQTLQVSTDEQELTGKNMVHPDDKTVSSKKKQSKAVEKVTVAEKENAPALRRSKRKTAVSDLISYAESPDDPKTSKFGSIETKPKKSVVKTKKGRSVKKNKPEVNLNQTTLSFSPVASVLNKSQNAFESANPQKCILETSPSSEVTEDSGFDPSNGVSNQSPVHSTEISDSCTVENSAVTTNKEISILMSTNPPLSYWQDLAEQRRIALEKALHENELIYDQLSVLEAENSQLKQLVKEAENLAQVVMGVIE